MFRSCSDMFHPAEHALVQSFLDNIPIDKSGRTLLGYGPWKCPNRYARHEEEFPIKKATIYIGTHGALVASAKCSCGFRFTFLRTSDADPRLPIINSTHGLGPTWQAEAERLRQSGLSRNAIAKRMEVDFGTVTRLLRKKN
jgi:hypothetical protein